MEPHNGVEVRTYSKTPWYAKRVAKLPIPALLGLLIVSGFVAAQVLGPILGPKTQTVSVVNLTVNGLAGSDVLDPISYGTIDIVTLDASNSGAPVTNAGVQV